MQFENPSVWSEIERLTKSIAWKKNIPSSEIEDLVQDVNLKVWKHRDTVFQSGKIHYGYAQKCVLSVINDHKKAYFKSTNYLILDFEESSVNKKPEESIVSTDNHYKSDSIDNIQDNYDPSEEILIDQLFLLLKAFCDKMPEGLRKNVCQLCLSGTTDGGVNQGKDIAAKLKRDQKPVSQALKYVRDTLKLELNLALK